MNSSYQTNTTSETIILWKLEYYVSDMRHITNGTPRKRRSDVYVLLSQNTRFFNQMDVCKDYYILSHRHTKSTKEDKDLKALLDKTMEIVKKGLKKKLETIQLNILIAHCRGVDIDSIPSKIGVSGRNFDRELKILKRKLGLKPYQAIDITPFVK